MIFNAYAVRQVENTRIFFDFINNEWTHNFTMSCLTTKEEAEAYHNDLIAPFEVIEMNVSAVEASCQNCSIYNDIAHDCEFYVGYGKLDDLLSQAVELIKRGTKQSTEGLEEGVQYDKDVKEFLKQFKIH